MEDDRQSRPSSLAVRPVLLTFKPTPLHPGLEQDFVSYFNARCSKYDAYCSGASVLAWTLVTLKSIDRARTWGGIPDGAGAAAVVLSIAVRMLPLLCRACTMRSRETYLRLRMRLMVSVRLLRPVPLLCVMPFTRRAGCIGVWAGALELCLFSTSFFALLFQLPFAVHAMCQVAVTLASVPLVVGPLGICAALCSHLQQGGYSQGLAFQKQLEASAAAAGGAEAAAAVLAASLHAAGVGTAAGAVGSAAVAAAAAAAAVVAAPAADGGSTITAVAADQQQWWQQWVLNSTAQAAAAAAATSREQSPLAACTRLRDLLLSLSQGMSRAFVLVSDVHPGPLLAGGLPRDTQPPSGGTFCSPSSFGGGGDGIGGGATGVVGGVGSGGGGGECPRRSMLGACSATLLFLAVVAPAFVSFALRRREKALRCDFLKSRHLATDCIDRLQEPFGLVLVLLLVCLMVCWQLLVLSLDLVLALTAAVSP